MSISIYGSLLVSREAAAGEHARTPHVTGSHTHKREERKHRSTISQSAAVVYVLSLAPPYYANQTTAVLLLLLLLTLTLDDALHLEERLEVEILPRSDSDEHDGLDASEVEQPRAAEVCIDPRPFLARAGSEQTIMHPASGPSVRSQNSHRVERVIFDCASS